MNYRHHQPRAFLNGGRITGLLALWVVHVGLWFIYVSTFNKWEALVGCAAAALSTLGVAVVARLGLVKFRPSFGQLAEIRRIPWYAVSGTWEIIQGVGKQLFSKRGAASYLAAVPFEVGPDDSANAGRRALAVLYTTMTPNFVVVGIIREQGLMLYHQIVPGEVLQLTRDLGAKP